LLLGGAMKRVVMWVDDDLADLLRESLVEAGHLVEVTTSAESLHDRLIAPPPCDAAIVDLDTRGRSPVATLDALRALAPHTPIIALLPCGGFAGSVTGSCHAAIEKPARISAILSALAAVPLVR
jgi:DNA-binding NtrC family response regulator